MSQSLRFVFGCGGTGGHIIPGIAIALELRKKGCEVLFIGNRGSMESRLVAAEGFPFREIRVQKLYRKLSLSNLLFPFRLVTSTFAAFNIIKVFRPDGVICTGGFVSGPVAIASIMRRIPLFFHESNSYPGLTTRRLARYTRVTFTSFASTAKYLAKTRVEQLGIPLLERGVQEQAPSLAELGFVANKPILLVTGGSQGSQAINSVVDRALPRILEKGYQVLWQTGKSGYYSCSQRHKDAQGVHIFDFSPHLASFYKLAEVAVTRAGAMTLAELEANQIPSVLVPLPSAAENHQYFNALEQQKRGLALLLGQDKLTPESLLAALDHIRQHYNEYKASLDLPPNRAAADIASAILADLDKETHHAG